MSKLKIIALQFIELLDEILIDYKNKRKSRIQHKESFKKNRRGFSESIISTSTLYGF